MQDWLVARPIAHRGLHDRARGIVENSDTAAALAVARNYAIECDVQMSADGEAVVFHDFTLERLTARAGVVAQMRADELARLALTGASDCIPLFPDWLARIGGRVPVICEIKSAFDGDLRLAKRVAEIASAFQGPLALKSFDSDVIAFLRHEAPALGIGHVPLGIVAEANYAASEWAMLNDAQRLALSGLTHWSKTRPDFLSWHVRDLPHAAPSLSRAFGRPVMAWTVRSASDAALARDHADQIVFEGFEP